MQHWSAATVYIKAISGLPNLPAIPRENFFCVDTYGKNTESSTIFASDRK